MAGQTEILSQMEILWYATIEQIARLNLKDYKDLSSAYSAVGRALKTLEKKNLLQSTDTCYRLKGKEGEGKEHTLKITDTLIEILTEFPESQIQREPILSVPSRPDVFVLIKSRQGRFPFLLEVALSEKLDSIEQKLIDYQNWDGRPFKLPHCGVLIITDEDWKIEIEGVKVAKEFKKELLNG